MRLWSSSSFIFLQKSNMDILFCSIKEIKFIGLEQHED